MAVTLKPLQEQVIVITGASSGIGLATAREAVKRGVRGLVLAARNEDALMMITKELTDQGGMIAYAVADVGIPEDVQRIAETAIARFGGRWRQPWVSSPWPS
jgi:NAD(P)-dependent dehydrogenase (short-subunit alcohol dehydrogenase family)